MKYVLMVEAFKNSESILIKELEVDTEEDSDYLIVDQEIFLTKELYPLNPDSSIKISLRKVEPTK